MVWQLRLRHLVVLIHLQDAMEVGRREDVKGTALP